MPRPGDYIIYGVETSTGVRMRIRVEITGVDEEGFLVRVRPEEVRGLRDPLAQLVARGLRGEQRIPRGNRVDLASFFTRGVGPGILYTEPGSLPGGAAEESLRFMGAVLRVRASWDQEAGWLRSLEAEVRGR
ncbi:hypothetical protein CF15_08400 [Pyrodictium occultum]|uniref:Uncharacterized protein n=1 Tax=Pyrodictium occultum TaxID=2309 RepID=A0A0V8RRV9_PYROC|nr:hypothetical protein [Pyrodictium occultum]KSW10785.1 hypothetical protein CF15_08400 [Pyrodictium occultum]